MMKLIPGKLYQLQQEDDFWFHIKSMKFYQSTSTQASSYKTLEPGSILLFLEQETIETDPDIFNNRTEKIEEVYWFLTPDGQKVVTWFSAYQRGDFGRWYKEVKL